jgi:small subunit ribosomal protein S6
MNGKSSGFYVNAYFDAPGDLIDKIERTMRIDDNIMRYLTLKYDAKMLRHRDLQKKNAVPDIFAFEDEENEGSEEDED